VKRQGNLSIPAQDRRFLKQLESLGKANSLKRRKLVEKINARDAKAAATVLIHITVQMSDRISSIVILRKGIILTCFDTWYCGKTGF